MTSTADDPGRVGPVRVLDVSFRGRSWELHDVGRATWLVYPWGSTAQVWGRFHAIEWAGRADRWEAINRIGEVSRFATFGDAAMFACVLPDRPLHIDRAGMAARAAARLTGPWPSAGPADRSPGR